MQSVNKTILFGYIFELWSPGRSPWLKPGRAERIKSSSYEWGSWCNEVLETLLIDPTILHGYGVRNIITVSSLHLQNRSWYRTPDKQLDIRLPLTRKVISLHIVYKGCWQILSTPSRGFVWLGKDEMQPKKISYSQTEWYWKSGINLTTLRMITRAFGGNYEGSYLLKVTRRCLRYIKNMHWVWLWSSWRYQGRSLCPSLHRRVLTLRQHQRKQDLLSSWSTRFLKTSILARIYVTYLLPSVFASGYCDLPRLRQLVNKWHFYYNLARFGPKLL
jgi:hypothetical protein